jgi:PAS domain S-box-containing protein
VGAERGAVAADAGRVRELVAAEQDRVRRRADRLFAQLLVAQWVMAVAAAVWVSPLAWGGSAGRVHPHVWAAVGLGLGVIALPVRLAAVRPGWWCTRHAIAAAQMLLSALFIHLSGGRIETHFHVFGSLALLASYRDWRVLVTASAVTAADHLARGYLWPASVYGAAAGADWRWLEHAGWVVFLDVFLIYAMWHGLRDVVRGAEREAALEAARASTEQAVAARTRELWESEERSRAAFDHAALGMAVLTTDGRFVQVNRALCDLVGYSAAELLARRFTDLTHPDDRAGDADPVRRLLAGEARTYQREKRYVRRDGEVVWVRVNVSLVRGSAGGPDRVVSEILDITAQKRAEDGLRAAQESARKLALVARHTHNGVVVTDAAGRIEWVNEGYARLTGYELAEVVGRTPGSVVQGPGTDPATVGHARARVRAGEGFEVELLNYHKSGRAYWVRVEARPVHDEAGRLTNFIGVQTDVTAAREAARALEEAKAAAEAASRIKSEFLANMSHEIRTPMNGILGMTDLILETDLTREQRESLGLVKSSAEALLGIINDILDFSKIEAGKLELDPTPLFLRDVIGDALKPLAFGAHEKGLELACDLRPDVPDLAVGDPVRLRQVLTNLVGNAIKFTARGEVVVRAELVEESADAYRVRLGVTDTGIGIPADKLGSIFDPFTQADGSTTRRFGGSGLGLTICARLVGMMGGRIWVESEVGKGSTFFFEVRLDRARVSAERPAPLSADVRGLAVLVVDDNATNRRVLEDTLKNWGGRPVSADSGPAALAELRRAAEAGQPYPLVLLDAMMPGMDGFRVAEAVGKDPAIAGAAVLMLTSADATGDAARCRELGLAAYLVKPVKGSELNAAIAAALHGRPARTRVGVPLPAGALPADGAPAGRPLKVLVAEDNPVNQRVILRLLQKYGHQAVLANHGGEAIAALDREGFDVVFMDVQMPEVDGFAATKVIRDREAAGHRYGGWPRLPVVAMTAHAMKGDRERCLAHGMDDYVSKPVQRPELLRVLAWASGMRNAECGMRNQREAIPPQPPGSDSAFRIPQSTIPETPPLDREAALERLGGDEELFAEVAALFLSDAPRMVEDIRRAAEAGDPATLQRAAHTLKGAAGYVGGVAAAAAARRVEELAAAGELAAAADPVAAVAREADRLRAALAVTLTPSPAA